MSAFRFPSPRAIAAPVCLFVFGLLAATPVLAAPTISIADASITEGNSGTQYLTFTITLSAPNTVATRFNAATANGTATAGSDYVATSNSGLTIAAGNTSRTFLVPVNGDLVNEANETFFVNLSSPVGATIADGQAIGTITNDDTAGLPVITIADVSGLESDNFHSIDFWISLSKVSDTGISFDITTSDGTATGDLDYTPTTAHIYIPPGDTGATFGVMIHGDSDVEPDETFFVTASNVVGATFGDGQAVGTITNDDPNGGGNTPFVYVSSDSVVEGNSGTKTETFTVSLSEATTWDVSYDIATANLTAEAGSDYVAKALTGQVIPAGQTSKTFTVTVNGDTTVEFDEEFAVRIFNAGSGGNISTSEGHGRIMDDDGTTIPTISVGDVTVTEGNSGTKFATFTVSLSQATNHLVGYTITTADGTASSPGDYTSKTSPYYIDVGATTKTFSVSIIGDTDVEANESFTVNLTDVSGAITGDASGTATITNDDTAGGSVPTLSIGDVSIAEGNAGTKVATFTVSLSAAAASAVTYDIATANGTASAGSDYVASSLSGQSIAAGQTSKTFAVTINGDSAVEPNETFTVNASNVSGATVLDGNATGTITNDDTAGGGSGATLSIGDVSILEGNSLSKALTFTVTLSAPQATAVTFGAATANGTAVAGSDYVAKNSPDLRIAAGQTSKTFAVSVIGDTNPETNETFTVNLSNPVGASIADGQALGTISNDDGGGAMPSLSVDDVTISEGNSGTKNAVFTVSLSAPASAPVTYDIASGPLSTSDPATAGSDFVASSLVGQVIPAGQSSKTFSVVVNGDTEYEFNETYGVSVSNLSGATAAKDVGVGTITNDDAAPLPNLWVEHAEVQEGDSGQRDMVFNVYLSSASAQAISLDFATADGTAVAGQDYQARSGTVVIPAGTMTASINIPVQGDTVPEATENFTVSISNVVGAVQFGNVVLYGNIRDDDTVPLPTLSITSQVVSYEGNSGTTQAVFTLQLSAPASTDVSYDIATSNNTASAPADFVAKSLVHETIPAGQTSKTFSVTINGDTAVEFDEVYVVEFSNVSGAQSSGLVGIGTIRNDDGVPALSIGDVAIVEGNSGTKTAIFTLSLSQASSSYVTVDIHSADGTATAGSDYVSSFDLGFNFAPGLTSKTYAVTINGDTTVEAAETFTMTLSNVIGATIANGVATGTIINDDTALSIGDVTIAEGNSGTKTATFTVSLSAAVASAVTFDIATANGTATAGSDYVASSLTGQSIAAGQISKTFAVTINGDTTVEANETFTVNVSNVSGASVGDGSATATITNDDAAATPTLSIGDVSIAEGNAGTQVATFTVSLSAAASGAVTYDIATANGTATAGSDFVASSLVGQSIAAGQTSKTFAVTITGDTAVEANETFTVNVSNPVGATIADGQAVGTITNDDTAPVLPSLSIGDMSIAEGNAGTKVATFTVSLSAAAASAVTYDIATANGTATAGSDYVASSLAGQSITAGQTSKTFAVTINGDTTVEANETFTVNVSNVSGAIVGVGSATGTISNDDTAGGGATLSIGDVSIAEGNSLSKVLTFTVTLSAPQTSAVTFGAATANGTALSGSDYQAKNIPDNRISAGQTSKTFAVSIIGDTTVEPNETFVVNLSNPVGATIADGQAAGTISNDDAAALMAARFDARGLVDDLDDRNNAVQLSPREYALLLADTARQLCTRTGAATLIGVDGVENRAVLADLADAANLSCAGSPRYQAVMAEQGSTGFLVEAASDTDARGVQVIDAPTLDAKAGVAELTVQASGHARPITLLLPQALPTEAKARSAQLQALGQRVVSTLRADAQTRLVLIGGVTLNALLDLSARDAAKLKGQALPAERILLSPALQREFGHSTVEYLPGTAKAAAAQVLHLQQ